MKYTMKEWETLKVYGKRLNTWGTLETLSNGQQFYRNIEQVEYAYAEYDFTGKVINKGSEDFSFQRWDSGTAYYEIWTWDGQKVNKGGYRWFECARRVRINRADRKKLQQLAAKWFPEAAAIDIRKR